MGPSRTGTLWPEIQSFCRAEARALRSDEIFLDCQPAKHRCTAFAMTRGTLSVNLIGVLAVLVQQGPLIQESSTSALFSCAHQCARDIHPVPKSCVNNMPNRIKWTAYPAQLSSASLASEDNPRLKTSEDLPRLKAQGWSQSASIPQPSASGDP